MPTTTFSSARAEIVATAIDAGWHVEQRDITHATCTRGTDTIRVKFTRAGAVTFADNLSAIVGNSQRGKRATVLEWITHEKEATPSASLTATSLALDLAAARAANREPADVRPGNVSIFDATSEEWDNSTESRRSGR
jgi:hypothetical protein